MRITRSLDQWTTTGRSVLWIDDIQGTDLISSELLDQIRNGSGAGAATFRDGVLTIDAANVWLQYRVDEDANVEGVHQMSLVTRRDVSVC